MKMKKSITEFIIVKKMVDYRYIIEFKPVPSFQYSPPQSIDVSTGETVVQLSENRIGIINKKATFVSRFFRPLS